MTATGLAMDDAGGNGEVAVNCSLWEGENFLSFTEVQIGAAAVHGPGAPVAITTPAMLTGDGVVRLKCGSHSGSDHIEDLTVSAIKVDSLNVQ